jgi:hypothetical protein
LIKPEFKVTPSCASVSLAKKKIEICRENGSAVMSLANEYGNTVTYELDANQFESLLDAIWAFVKERH